MYILIYDIDLSDISYVKLLLAAKKISDIIVFERKAEASVFSKQKQ